MFNNKKIIVIRNIIILVIIVLFVAVLALIFRSENCVNYECFQRNMVKCERATYINEEPVAAWHYEVKGEKDGECQTEVTLLLAKQGELGLDELEGLSMTCSYPLGVSAYPDKDLSVCHGRLKEDLQGIIIEKLHKYVLENLGEISEKLGGV